MRTPALAVLAALLSALGLAPMAAAAPVPKATKETPEVEAYLEAKGWKIARETHPPSIKSQMTLTVAPPRPKFGVNPPKAVLDDEAYRMLAGVQTVDYLDLQHVDSTDAGLATVAGNRALARIGVGGSALTDGGLKKLAGAIWLRHVSIASAPKITEGGVRELAKLIHLEALELHNIAVTGACFDAFAGAEGLKTLVIKSGATTDAGAGRIAELPALATLVVDVAGAMTTAGVKAIVAVRVPAEFLFDRALLDDALLKTLVSKGRYDAVLPQPIRATRAAEVRFIQLPKCAVTDKGFECLLDCTETEGIALSDSAVTDATFLKMGGFQKLRSIALRGGRVTAAGLAAISGAPIESVLLTDGPLSEASFESIGKMPKLKSLIIGRCAFDSDWVKHLAPAAELQRLVVGGSGFDDGAAKHLAGMRNLNHLNVDATKVTDKGFAELLKLPKLTQILVAGSQVTEAACLKAKTDYPKTIVMHSFPRR